MNGVSNYNTAVRYAKWLYIFSSILLFICGLFLVINPGISRNIISDIFGVFLLIFGISKFFGYFSNEKFHLAFQFDFALGIVVILLGILLLFHPEKIVSFVWIFLGIYEIIDGAFKLQTAMEAKKFGMEKWWILLMVAIICIVFGLFLIYNPLKSNDLFIRIVGISLFVVGLQNLFTATYTIKSDKKSFK